uniref:Uncharacterized protein AlNc14C91G5708 n=1 Tax=Albugo laibachii Nc14 TaxID=890382 RepID=F0WGH5_9STRA|nr:conserved hypothetical protein [Albugo laibachii Nc14]|eukprot:CCA20338.1 conserved hypothetical protein [Albugo laibachii Nc14]
MQMRHQNVLRKLEQDYERRKGEQMGDVREKIRLLQIDRKSNISSLESNKHTNKEYIRELKDENRELRKQLADCKQNTTDTISYTTANAVAGRKAEGIEELLRVLDRSRKQYDDVRHRVQSQSALYEDLKDEFRDLELDSKKPSVEGTPEVKKIRVFECRLDKAMMKYNEAQNICRTYRQIVKRLQEERIAFDTQISAIEKTLGCRDQDHEELILLYSDATQSKEHTYQELEKAKSKYEEEKRYREQELKGKQHILKLRLEALPDKDSDAPRNSKLESFLEDAEISPGKTEVHERINAQESECTNAHWGQNSTLAFLSAFRGMMETLGSNNVDEAIEKLIHQDETMKKLLNLLHENEHRLLTLQQSNTDIEERLRQRTFNRNSRHKIEGDHNKIFNPVLVLLERARVEYGHYNTLLTGIKAGVGHLVDQIKRVEDNGVRAPVTDESVCDAIEWTQNTLKHMLDRVKDARSMKELSVDAENEDHFINNTVLDVHHSEADNATSAFLTQGVDIHHSSWTNEGQQRAQRDNAAISNRIGRSLTSTITSEEAMSRDHIKLASNQLVMAQRRKTKGSIQVDPQHAIASLLHRNTTSLTHQIV